MNNMGQTDGVIPMTEGCCVSCRAGVSVRDWLFPLALLAALFLACCTIAQEPAPAPQPADGLTVPKEVTSAPHKLAAIKAETAGKKIVWRYPPEVSAEVKDDGKCLICTAPPGRYPILVATAIGDKPILADTVLIVSGTPPGPGPGPIIPPGPGPSDAMQDAIRKAFRSKPPTQQLRNDAGKLAGLYRLAVTQCGAKEHATCLDLIGVIRAAADLLTWESPTHLEVCRGIVADELGRIAEPESPLTAELRTKLAGVYGRAATILEELSK